MILSVSRRTDIPSFYSEWFFHRLQEQSVLVRNPRYKQQVRAVSLSPDLVDCIVFWSKNPQPMPDKLYQAQEKRASLNAGIDRILVEHILVEIEDIFGGGWSYERQKEKGHTNPQFGG
ncbi:DUF1848 family protein [Breznakiellaceae bacterium SP9]